jgi:thioredoxin reductase (NADPH)
MYDLLIIGAGPGGIALAAEADASGIDPSQILILEKGSTHNSAIRQLYPEQKLTTANYKGFAARCEGLLCVHDMTKPETLKFFDQIISDYHINLLFNAEVFGMRRLEAEGGARFGVASSQGVFESKVLACGIGIFGRPNKPKEYRLPPTLKDRLLFDMTSHMIQNETVLVVGGGDTAAEFVQYLRQQGNRVTLSYRKSDFTRLNQENLDSLMTMEEQGEVEILRLDGVTSTSANEAVTKRLAEEFGVLTVRRTGPAAGDCIRVTPSVYTSADDVIKLVNALRSITASPRS